MVISAAMSHCKDVGLLCCYVIIVGYLRRTYVLFELVILLLKKNIACWVTLCCVLQG